MAREAMQMGQGCSTTCFNLGTITIPVAEVIALRNSLIYAKNQGLAKIEVEGNSKLVIDAVNGVSSPPWKLLKLVQDIKALSSSFEFVKFKHVFREANFVANALANLGHMVDNMNLWEECVPPEVSSTLTFNIVNIGCVKDTSV
ncbi:PREDICTED: uncharacterized protein LOC101294915 [Fragaria vesca subsp. vesca]